MLEITDASITLLNSIVDVVIIVVISFIIIFTALTIKVVMENKKIKKNTAIVVEVLDCIRNHYDAEKVEKLQWILQTNKNLVHFVYGPTGNTPFLVACESGATEIVLEMLKLGADTKYTNYDGNGPMYFAVYFMTRNMEIRDATLIRTLYYCGCDINLANKKGYTPLHLAAYYGHVPLIYWLLSKGANVDIPPLSSGLALSNVPEYLLGPMLIFSMK